MDFELRYARYAKLGLLVGALLHWFVAAVMIWGQLRPNTSEYSSPKLFPQHAELCLPSASGDGGPTFR